MTENKFDAMVKKAVLMGAVSYNGGEFDYDTAMDFVKMFRDTQAIRDALEWVADACDDTNIKLALMDTISFLAHADIYNKDIISKVYDYADEVEEERKNYALEVAEKYYNTLTDRAKTLLEVCENVKSAQDLADLVIPDVTDFKDITFQLYEDLVVNELLNLELKNVENVAEVLYK